ncbi:MAG: DUF4189 domain-containing protein [Rhodocyclaceae bacterium]
MLRIPSVLSLLKATATVTLLLSATNALAWSAVAAWDGRYAHVTYNDPTPEGAKKEAIAKCEKVTQRECELLGNAVRNTTLVVARAVKRNHIFFASNPDPLEAAQEVMRTCRLHEGDCVITSVAWDGGPTWWAVAFGDDDVDLHRNLTHLMG